MTKLSHIDNANQPTMVDVSDKTATDRQAHARAIVEFPEDVAARFSGGDIETAKGPVFATAIVAGVMGAKRTHELIPFCHPLGLSNCKITIELDDYNRAVVDCICKVHHKTGVEMEALTAVSIAALTIYDMVKSVDKTITIGHLRLVKKLGGKSGDILIGNNGE